LRVRLTTGRFDFETREAHSPGDELELDDALAQRMIDTDQAERVASGEKPKTETQRRTRRVIAPAETR
jgi:hypothetical protein